MARRKFHDTSLPSKLNRYAEERSLDFHQYNQYHMRLMDGGYTTLDIWTTGRYYILSTDFHELGAEGMVERGGEKGNLPSNDMLKLATWLDKLFFAVEE